MRSPRGVPLRLDSREWHARLAGVLDAVGSESFAPALVAALDDLIWLDSAIVFAFRETQPPLILHDRLAEEEREAFYATWLGGVYLLSPFYRAFRDGQPDGLYRMRELAPAGFTASEYYRRYYRLTASSDLAGFLVRAADAAIVVSVGRRQPHPRFTRADLLRLEATAPMVSALGTAHWRTLRADAPQDPQRHAGLESRLAAFGADRLTRREREVLHLLLDGHSSKSIARAAGMLPETARVHRRNIYAKLEVSSQGELFARLLRWLGSDQVQGWTARERAGA